MKIRAEINQQRQKINKSKRWCLERSIKLPRNHRHTKNKIYSTHCIYIFVHTYSKCVCLCVCVQNNKKKMLSTSDEGRRRFRRENCEVENQISKKQKFCFCQFLRRLTRRVKPQTGKLGIKDELLITTETEVYTMKNFMFYFWCTPHQIINAYKNYLKRLTPRIWILT